MLTYTAKVATTAFLIVASVVSFVAAANNLPATASIEPGTIVGTQTSLPSATAPVNKFLGVPFAQSPPQRFEKAIKPQNFSQPLNTTAWKPACIQQFLYPLPAQIFAEGVFNQPPPAEESEDCLYLNVYAPSSAAPEGGRAVMFWIYGGALQFGHAGQPTYDGSAFAAYQDVIVVAPNYRTNVFGFPGLPGKALDDINLGLYDQRMALEWVQTNIDQFGGDPAKVTIFGESAGAFSVDILLTSYNTSNAPFRAAILESGQVSYSGDPMASTPNGFEMLATALNCSNPSSNVSCVTSAPATAIQQIIDEQSIAFMPVADNITRVSSPANARAAGNFAKVPILTGNNFQEGRLFEFSMSNLTVLLNYLFGLDVPQSIPGIEAAFPIGDVPLYNDAFSVLSEVFTLYIFQCGQALQANQTASQGVPTWRYIYNASFPNQEIFLQSGAYHSVEVAAVFQTYPGGPVNMVSPVPLGLQPANLPPTSQQYALSSYMNTAWAKFAKNPEGGPGWPALGTFSDDIGVLGANGTSGVAMINQQDVDSKCSLFFPAYQALAGGNLPDLPS